MDFSEHALWITTSFAVSACMIWVSDTDLSIYINRIADRTGIGNAFAGALLLGCTTNLPELAVTLRASYSGAEELAGSNLIGSIVMQSAVWAFIDAFVMRGRPLTFFSPKASLLTVGVMLVTLTGSPRSETFLSKGKP